MKKYTLIHKNTNKVLGYLEVNDKGHAVFRLANGVSPLAWNAVGFMPVDPNTGTLEDQGKIYYSLHSRLPLKARMNSSAKSHRDILNYLRGNPLSVVTDSLSFVNC